MLAVAIALMTFNTVGQSPNRSFTGFVPDQETAITIGRAILKSRLGPSIAQEPLIASKYMGYWIVKINQPATVTI